MTKYKCIKPFDSVDSQRVDYIKIPVGTIVYGEKYSSTYVEDYIYFKYKIYDMFASNDEFKCYFEEVK